MQPNLARAETELTKARDGYAEYVDDTRNTYQTFYAATVHHHLGEAQLRHAGMTLLEANTICQEFEHSNLPLASVIAQYEATHTV